MFPGLDSVPDNEAHPNLLNKGIFDIPTIFVSSTTNSAERNDGESGLGEAPRSLRDETLEITSGKNAFPLLFQHHVYNPICRYYGPKYEFYALVLSYGSFRYYCS